MKITRGAVVAAIAASLIAILGWAPLRHSKPVAAPIPQTRPTPKALSLIQDQESKEPVALSEGELAELVAPKESLAGRTACVTDSILKPGETKVTRGYMSENGEFVFSVLKPIPKTREDGKLAFNVEVERFYLRAAGDMQSLFSHPMPVNPGFLTGSGYRGNQNQGPEHRLEIRADFTLDGNIRFRTKEFDALRDEKGNLLNDPGSAPR